MARHSGPSGIWTTFATTSGWPLSSALSTANAAASSSKGTSSVARSTGRRRWPAAWVCSLGGLRRSVCTGLLRVKVPVRGCPSRAPRPPSPDGEIEEEPDRGDPRHEEDERRVDEHDQRNDHRGHETRDDERLEAHA